MATRADALSLLSLLEQMSHDIVLDHDQLDRADALYKPTDVLSMASAVISGMRVAITTLTATDGQVTEETVTRYGFENARSGITHDTTWTPPPMGNPS